MFEILCIGSFSTIKINQINIFSMVHNALTIFVVHNAHKLIYIGILASFAITKITHI